MDMRHRPDGVDRELSNVDVVRAVTTLLEVGLTDDGMALVHPDVTWMPLSRPGRSLYVGHDGTRALLADSRSQLGEFQTVWDGIVDVGPDRVDAIGTVVRAATGERGRSVVAHFTLRDGMVLAMETEYLDG